MAKKKVEAVRIANRAALKAYLAISHKEGATCRRDPLAQLTLGGWARSSAPGGAHLFGGAAVVRWKFTCPGCKASIVVEMD